MNFYNLIKIMLMSVFKVLLIEGLIWLRCLDMIYDYVKENER